MLQARMALTIHSGLDREFVQALLLQPRTTVIAKSLLACHKLEGTKLIVENIDATTRFLTQDLNPPRAYDWHLPS